MSNEAQAKSQEQIDAEKAAAKEQAKAQKEAKQAADKAERERVQGEKKAAAAEAKAKRDAAAAEAKAKKDADKAAKAAEKVAKAAEKAAAAGVKKERVVMPSQNGITRPRPDTRCARIWAIADELSAKFGQPTPISELAPVASAENINDATTRTQYARWKQYNGVFGPVPKLAKEAPATEASTTEGAGAA